MQLLSFVCGRDTVIEINMNSPAFNIFCLPTLWPKCIGTSIEIPAQDSSQAGGKRDDHFVTLSLISFGSRSETFNHSTCRQTKPATKGHACQLLSFQALGIHSSSLESSSSSSVAFFANFFFFFFLFFPFAPVDFAIGCSRIFRISSSVIFFSV